MATELGLIGTLESDNDMEIMSEKSDNEDEVKIDPRKTKRKNKHDGDFNEGFEFVISDDEEKTKQSHSEATNAKTVRTRKHSNDEDTECIDEDDNETVILDTVKEKDKRKKKLTKGKKDGTKTEDSKGENISYSEVVTSFEGSSTFKDMELSRPILKALNLLGWDAPTPIQAAVIPKALMGRDICACAATGTGKTGAFMIPVLERLIFKPNSSPMTRVLVLTPTRELAIQNYEVSKKLAQFTKIQISLSAGGTDRNAQEAALRLGPDVVIATLGRLIDHLQNAPSFNLDNIEILILDEADRMLDEFFAEQMKEVMACCSRNRQTLLFSATMTEKVEDLAAVSLHKPMKVFVNDNTTVATNLYQEFIRIRPKREDEREAIVAALVKRFFQEECIIFVQTKKEAHRLRLILTCLGIKAAELHGNLSQPQRLDALKQFKDSEVDVLVATDVAARGLDIAGVKTVINTTMPPSIERYIHRVGRTARAGRNGRSVTLVGEHERGMLTKIANATSGQIMSRTVKKEVISEFKEKISHLKKELKELDATERQEKELRVAELKVNKATKILENKEEVKSRPKRTWFQTHQERKQETDHMKKLIKVNDGEDQNGPKSKRSKLR